jgi:hypothetical protein
MSDDRRVLISGAGPVGLFCALLLGRAGVPVRVFDANPCLQEDPRAATTHPATLELLGKAGLADEMARVGLVAPIFQFWDRPAKRLVAEFDHALLKDDTEYPYVIQCEQFKTSQILLARIEAELKNVEVIFNAQVTGFTQSDAGIDLDVTIDGKAQRHHGGWLIGADGGRSTVRKAADIAFEGFTWAERFLVLTTPFDFEKNLGYSYRSYFADPDEWCNCFKVAANGPPGLWRTVFPTDNSVSEESLMNDEAVQARLVEVTCALIEERGGQAKLHIVEPGTDEREFWLKFGVAPTKITAPATDDEAYVRDADAKVKLMKMSDATGRLVKVIDFVKRADFVFICEQDVNVMFDDFKELGAMAIDAETVGKRERNTSAGICSPAHHVSERTLGGRLIPQVTLEVHNSCRRHE